MFLRNADQNDGAGLFAVAVQCARALIRSGLWTIGDGSAGLPSMGEMLREITEGRIDGMAYDTDWPLRATQTMW